MRGGDDVVGWTLFWVSIVFLLAFIWQHALGQWGWAILSGFAAILFGYLAREEWDRAALDRADEEAARERGEFDA